MIRGQSSKLRLSDITRNKAHAVTLLQPNTVGLNIETCLAQKSSDTSTTHCAIAQILGDAQVGLVHCIQSIYKEGWLAIIQARSDPMIHNRGHGEQSGKEKMFLGSQDVLSA